MKKPILGIRCNQCGRVYFGHALASPIDDVVKADEARFRALCKKHGFKMPKETKPKKKK